MSFHRKSDVAFCRRSRGGSGIVFWHSPGLTLGMQLRLRTPDRCLLLVISLMLSWNTLGMIGAEPKALRQALEEALRAADRDRVYAAVEALSVSLGDRAGVPEVKDHYIGVPADAKWIGPDTAQKGFVPYMRQLERMRWWRVGVDPTRLKHPLRGPASVLGGMVAVCRAGLDGREQTMRWAEEASAFLMWAQAQGGVGVYPFPAARAVKEDRAMAVAADFLERAERDGKLGAIVKRGWIVDDLDTGALQFDNGECGVAMFEFYELTRSTAVLESAMRSAEWALGRGVVANWNYNSFSVWLLAKAYAVTGDRRFLEGALGKALIGVVPGQLRVGPMAGRWMDPHNARPAYHYIMLRALAQLLSVMPTGDPNRETIARSLKLGLRTRNQEMVRQGVMNKDKAMEALLLVTRIPVVASEVGRASLTTDALGELARGVSWELRSGKSPMGPRELGLFLEYTRHRVP